MSRIQKVLGTRMFGTTAQTCHSKDTAMLSETLGLFFQQWPDVWPLKITKIISFPQGRGKRSRKISPCLISIKGIKCMKMHLIQILCIYLGLLAFQKGFTQLLCYTGFCKYQKPNSKWLSLKGNLLTDKSWKFKCGLIQVLTWHASRFGSFIF